MTQGYLTTAYATIINRQHLANKLPRIINTNNLNIIETLFEPFIIEIAEMVAPYSTIALAY